MKLRREKDNPEDQSENAEARCFAGHVVTKTEFRQEWNLSVLALWPVTGARLWVALGGGNPAVGR